MERRLGFVPFHARVLDPEISVAGLAPIFHLAGVEKLNGKVEPTQLTVFPDVPGKFSLQALRIALFQGVRRIVRGWYGRKLRNVLRSVTKRNGAPIAQLLV